MTRMGAVDNPTLTLPLRGQVLFPGQIQTLLVGRSSSVIAVQRHLEGTGPLLLVPQHDADEEDPLQARLAQVGTLGQVLRAAWLPDGQARLLIEGIERTWIASTITLDEGASFCSVRSTPEVDDDPIRVGALAAEARELYARYLTHNGMNPADQEILAADGADPSRLADQVAAHLEMGITERITLLEELSLERRLHAVIGHLATALARQEIGAEVHKRVQEAMDRSQREYTLKEQLRVIREELGDALGAGADADHFEARIRDMGMSEEVESEALREVERLRRIHQDSAEYTITRTWLETVCELPWSEVTRDRTSITRAQRVLDQDHYALDKVKERILEYLAVRQLNPDSKGPILCFVGPPGVGKTSLGRSIARALGRNYARVALGGVKDETEIRGHRRTYVGALPGRIIRAMARAGSLNPVIVLDELDKVGNDFRGDPASALLEVLDPEQNHGFVDHYLDLPFDLSQVLFIATANLPEPIPPALADRLEIIELPGYTEEDKLEIARRFLIPRVGERHGLDGKRLVITKAALERTIRDYTREAGVRELERQLATLHRKVARQVVEGHEGKVRITPNRVPNYLGPRRFFMELAERVDQPGVVIGLAWTAAGGDILFIEATRMEGKGGLKLTGSLGEVMKESAEAAMSWLRTHAADFDLTVADFEADFHLHVPAGAIPKDGPSAGVTMAAALASVVTRRPVRARVAMTGEITLRGKVLPVGGVKEKVLAARRAGIEVVILPRHNCTDLEDIPEVLRRDLRFELVDTVDEVLRLALA